MTILFYLPDSMYTHVEDKVASNVGRVVGLVGECLFGCRYENHEFTTCCDMRRTARMYSLVQSREEEILRIYTRELGPYRVSCHRL